MKPSTGWLQVGKRGTGRPCAICQRMDWCRETRDGAVAHCKRMGDGSFRRGETEGWYHRLTADAPRVAPVPRPAPAPVETPDFATLCRRFAKACTAGPLDHLAGKLGLLPATLRRYRVGWAVPVTTDAGTFIPGTSTPARLPGVWTFPMSSAAGDVIGVRVRTVSGDKYSLSGSVGDALFIPTGLAEPHTLLLPEGPTSAAALTQLGFAAVGRPNNRAGARHVAALISRLRPRRVVVFGDNDAKEDGSWPGLDGAVAFSHDIAAVAHQFRILVTIMLPPQGIKDARAWLAAGATVIAIHHAIQDSFAPPDAGAYLGRRSA